jgi:hypothetical protein
MTCKLKRPRSVRSRLGPCSWHLNSNARMRQKPSAQLTILRDARHPARALRELDFDFPLLVALDQCLERLNQATAGPPQHEFWGTSYSLSLSSVRSFLLVGTSCPR